MADNVIERAVVAIGFEVEGAQNVLTAYAGFTSAVAGATAAALGFTVSQAAVDDDITKTAHSLGLATDAYTALTYAMDREGVSSSQLGGSLKYLQTQLEAAARGSGEALPWFQRFGIKATDSLGRLRKASDVLPELAQHLEGLDDGTLQGASLRLLGENGLRMGRALAKGDENLLALLEDARTLGYVLDEEAAAKAEALTDSMTRVRAATTGVKREFANALSPTITDLANRLADLIGQQDGFARVSARKAGEAFGWTLRQLDTDAGMAAAALGGLAVAVKLPSMIGSIPVIGSFASALGLTNPLVLAGAAATGLLVLAVDDLATAARGGDSVIMDLAESIGQGETLTWALQEAQMAAVDSSGMLAAAWDALGATGEALWPKLRTGTLFAATSLYEGASATLEWLDALARLVLPVDGMTAGIEAMGDALARVVGLATDFKSATAGWTRFAAWLRGEGDQGVTAGALGGAILGNAGAGLVDMVGAGAGAQGAGLYSDALRYAGNAGASLQTSAGVRDVTVSPSVQVVVESVREAAESVRDMVYQAGAQAEVY